MKVETINCQSIQATGENLVMVLNGTSFEEIESTLVGKRELSVFADNQDESQLVEKHYDYAKADSCKYDFTQKTYTLTLRKMTSLEIEVEELKQTVSELKKEG